MTSLADVEDRSFDERLADQVAHWRASGCGALASTVVTHGRSVVSWGGRHVVVCCGAEHRTIALRLDGTIYAAFSGPCDC